MTTIKAVIRVILLTAGVGCCLAGPKPKLLSGSQSTSGKIVFKVDQKYCAATNSYSYDSSKTPTVTVGAVPDGVKVDSPIPSLAAFDDPGDPIIPRGADTRLMDDGSDSSRLLVRAFGAGVCPGTPAPPIDAKPYRLLDSQYYVINIVQWGWSASASALQVKSQDWYVLNTSDGKVAHQIPFMRFHPNLSKDLRIYGSSSVGFLAIHLRPDDVSQDGFSRLNISYNVTVEKKQPINVQDLMALIGVLTGGAGPEAAKAGQPQKVAKTVPPIPIGLYGGGLLSSIETLPDDITFAATVTFPANFNKPAGGAAGAAATTAPASSGVCDTTIDSKSQTQATCSFSNKYDDEGLYHWDIGVGVPVKALNEVQYSSVDGTVATKTISRTNAYGFFDLYPVAEDIKQAPAFAWPHLVVGLPFSGKVFDKPFFGGGGVINIQSIPGIGPALSKIIPIRFGFFGGVVWEKEAQPAGLPVGSTASPAAVVNKLVGYRVWRGQFGIEFSIRDVKDKLTGSKNKSSSAAPTSN